MHTVYVSIDMDGYIDETFQSNLTEHWEGRLYQVYFLLFTEMF